MEFKDWLTKQLKRKGWSVNELARRIHMNPSNFRKLIHGGYIKEPTQHLKRVSVALGYKDDVALAAYRGNMIEGTDTPMTAPAEEQLEKLVRTLFASIPDDLLMNLHREEAERRGLL
jgi:hypothetical protein